MFQVKICGVRLISDVDAVAAAGGDAVGLNFFAPSVRYCSPDDPATAELSAHAAASGLIRVGVFVNESPQRIESIAKTVGLDAVQLHGDETVAKYADLLGSFLLAIRLRAIKLPSGSLSVSQIEAAARPWINARFHPLFDADAGAAHGGSGKTLDWLAIAKWSESNPGVDWTLAGGLTPENVAEAIRISGAKSVDTASGVESPKGTKSAELIRRFITAAKSA